METRSVTILGGGNTAFATAAQLTLRGFEITLFELPEFSETVDSIRKSHVIHLDGVLETGPARIHRVTDDIENALAASNLVLLIVPAYAHRVFAEACAPHLRSEHTVILMPGTLGSLEWAQLLKRRGVKGVTLAEVDTAPYVCRKTSPDSATIWGEVTALGMGVLPIKQTERVRVELDPLFPGITVYPDVIACGLSAMNPVVHPPGVLMNAGRIEYSRGEFYFYEEGVSPSVAKVIMRVDDERLAIGQALGHNLKPAHKAFHDAGFGPSGDLWAAINGSRMLTALKAPGNLESRWLTEDIPYGLASWSMLGTQFGVETPLMRSFVDIGSVVMGFDVWENGRSPSDLGIAGMGVQELQGYLTTGLT